MEETDCDLVDTEETEQINNQPQPLQVGAQSEDSETDTSRESEDLEENGDNTNNMPTRALDEIDDPELLRQMVREARGENKVYLRMDPPTLDECEDFEVFKNCLTVWKAGTAYADHQQAAAVIAGISDNLKYYKKGLKSKD